MARQSDHEQRDAEFRVRSEVSQHLGRYSRRIIQAANAYVAKAVSEAVREGREIDGVAIGRAAAERAIAQFFPITGLAPALEANVSDSPNKLPSTGE